VYGQLRSGPMMALLADEMDPKVGIGGANDRSKACAGKSTLNRGR
jgi:hypothetical protein